jgi:hypothetical protein
MPTYPKIYTRFLETNDPKRSQAVQLSNLMYMLVVNVKAKSCISISTCASILEYYSSYVTHLLALALALDGPDPDFGFGMLKLIIDRASMSWKHFKVARFQIAKCASNGGSLADGFMDFACGMSLILVGSLWQILQWPRNRTFL